MPDRLRDILKRHKIKHSVITEALGINRINISRYDNLMDRPVKEVVLISKATGIKFSELIGINDKDTKVIDTFLSKLAKNEKEKE